jgi:hypothetical protein
VRTFKGLGELSRAFEEAAIIHTQALHAAAAVSGAIIKKNVEDTFGDKTKLAALAQATIDERTALNLPPDLPLYRTGELLKDSVRERHVGPMATVGSPEPIMFFHEEGSVNVRAGTSNVPRPVFRIGMEESRPEIEDVILPMALGVTFGGTGKVVIIP